MYLHKIPIAYAVNFRFLLLAICRFHLKLEIVYLKAAKSVITIFLLSYKYNFVLCLLSINIEYNIAYCCLYFTVSLCVGDSIVSKC